MSKVKEQNYVVIQGWMLSKLQLKGNDLLIYAIIYGFSQNTDCKFTGSLQYLADWTNSTKQGVLNSLKKLLHKKLITKKDYIINGVKFVEYYSNDFNEAVKKVEQGYSNNFNGGVQITLPNNTNDKLIDNSINNTNTASGFSNKKEIPTIPILENVTPTVKESLTVQSVEVTKRFQKPTVTEVLQYADDFCKKENIKLSNLTAEMKSLFDFYEDKDWKVGTSKMKDWGRAVNRWIREVAKKEELRKPKTEAQKFLINTENRKAVVDTEAVKKQEEVLREYAKVKTLEPEFMEHFKSVLKHYFGGNFTSTIDNLKIKSINANEIVFMLPNQAYVDIMHRNKQKFEGTLKREIEGFFKKEFTGIVTFVCWNN